MPTLPTFDVTDEQAARLMAAFGTPAAYKAWLRRQIVDAVKRIEGRQRAQQVKDFEASLPPLDDLIAEEPTP